MLNDLIVYLIYSCSIVYMVECAVLCGDWQELLFYVLSGTRLLFNVLPSRSELFYVLISNSALYYDVLCAD